MPPPPPLHLHLPLSSLSLSLILKLAATSITGITALVAWRNMLRNDTLQTQFHHIRTSLRFLRRSPTIYLLGFKGRGKSAFLNTACRVLGEEDGPLVFRSETAPLGPTRTTVQKSAVHLSAGNEDGESCVVTFVDTPGLPLRFLRRGDVEEALRPVPEAGVPAPDCVVVVLRCSDVLQRAADMRLAEIVEVVRERGLHFILLLTHKKSLRSMKQMGEIRKEVATRARTDCIYFIENYTVGSPMDDRNVIAVRNNFDTHNVTLAVIRQCIEFAIIHRSCRPQATS
ncbi:hypothetical protein CKAN_02324200 [Cinnamomum micranthum f. kanehirae]|uniref:Uncharacterized protein n=1 Tax=Cinnamomum micranthum f. kanehirae TaxID=337451 RepID=A0A3S3NKJ5_9MAGN|nr:hypothetical protein CKAN_02324200 [Cinnamomum micranthum f. kanehirae]